MIEGLRRRKTIRGNVITDEIVQINLKIIEKAKKQQKETKKAKAKVEETPTKETGKAETTAQKPVEKKNENL